MEIAMNDAADTQAIVLHENPGQLMRQATDVAGVCREIVMKTACNIQGRKYVKCEGWMSIATAHGCIASSRDVQRVEGGWVAIGEIRRISDGVLLSQAEGYVGKDEKRWGSADEYACRAMAQTRAISRACRAAFAHVVVLIDGGLSTTPAEEVPDGGFENAKPRQQNLAQTAHIETPQATATVSIWKTSAERNKWLNDYLSKCRTELGLRFHEDPAAAIEYFQKSGLLMPNEATLADASFEQLFPSVPTSQADGESDTSFKAHVAGAVANDAKRIMDGFLAFQRGDQIPNAESVGDDSPPQPEGAFDPVPAGAMHLKIDVVAISKKEGNKKDGTKWVRYGVKDENDNWYGTFSQRVGGNAEALKGQKATVFYTENERGYDLHKILPA